MAALVLFETGIERKSLSHFLRTCPHRDSEWRIDFVIPVGAQRIIDDELQSGVRAQSARCVRHAVVLPFHDNRMTFAAATGITVRTLRRRAAMPTTPHRRQVVLFLVAVLFPSTVLVGLGFRIIGQERELADKRLTDDRRRYVAELRQSLLTHLEAIELEAVSAVGDTVATRSRRYQNPAVALVAQIVGGRVVMPWELQTHSRRAHASLSEPSFAMTIARGERAELVDSQTDSALNAYSAAETLASSPIQTAYARLLRARVLRRSGRAREAAAIYHALLALPTRTTDDHGVPVALYAARSLLENGDTSRNVERRLQAELESSDWRSPAVVYLLRDLILASGAATPGRSLDSSLSRIQTEIALVERALVLQREFPTLGLGTAGQSGASASWLPFADGAWLVTAHKAAAGAQPVLVAIDTRGAMESLTNSTFSGNGLPPAELRVGDAPGEPLGARFPGIKANFPDPPADSFAAFGLPRSFFLLALSLALGIALFGGYLLWLDMRRETRLAELRAHFVASVSHELKTPLTAIRMFAETLRDDGRGDEDQRTEYLDTIVGESERLTRLLNNVLDHSQIEREQKIYRRESTALADVVRRAATAMEYPLRQGGFTLTLDTGSGIPKAAVDSDAVEQAILNLLTNAMKYSGDNRDIALRLRSSNGHAIIDVTDRGVGIPLEEQSRLTEKFYRVRSSATEGIPGTGLGLTLVDHMARAHGGFLTVSSTPGKGSTFSIHLPIAGVT